MISIITILWAVFGVIFILGIIWTFKENDTDYFIAYSIVIPVLGFIITLIIGFIGMGVSKRTLIKSETIPIYSLKSSTKNEFYLGNKRTVNEECYYFFKKNGKGLIRDEALSDRTTIIENNDSPCYKFNVYRSTNLFWPIVDEFKWDEELIVPKGTLILKFNVE